MKFETTEYLKKASFSERFKILSDEEIKDLQKELLNILTDFDNVCKKNNIDFFLSGGTALGAVRHKGFIPWDDDIDLNIVRNNVPKLLNIYETELKEKYYLHTPETNPDLGLGFIRLRKKGTVLKAREDIFNDEDGIFLDIFIVENTYNNILLRTSHGIASYITGFLLSCRNFYKNRELYYCLSPNNYVFKVKIYIGFLLSFLPVRTYATLWNNVNKMCSDENSTYVTIPSGRKHFFKELYLREKFVKTRKIQFENLLLPISADYDYYLKKIYGDYLVIPKEKERHIILDYKNETNQQRNVF